MRKKKVSSSSIIEMSRHSDDNLTKKIVEDSIVDNSDQIDEIDTVLSQNVVEEDRKEKRVKLKTVIDWGKEEILKKGNMSEWLAYELDKTGKYVVSISCRTCKKFEEQLKRDELYENNV